MENMRNMVLLWGAYGAIMGSLWGEYGENMGNGCVLARGGGDIPGRDSEAVAGPYGAVAGHCRGFRPTDSGPGCGR